MLSAPLSWPTTLTVSLVVLALTVVPSAPAEAEVGDAPAGMISWLSCEVVGDQLRIALGVDPGTRRAGELLGNPDRLYFDFQNTRPARNIDLRKFAPCRPVVTRVRVVEHEPGTTRVVFDLAQRVVFSTAVSSNGSELIILLREAAPAKSAARRFAAAHSPPAAPQPAPVQEAANPPVPPEIPEDLLALIKSADAGDSSAQAALGWAHDSGQLGVQHYSQARYWYERAAQQGDVFSAIRLGEMYAQGIGTDRDLKEAARWYGSVAERSAYARQRLDSLTADQAGLQAVSAGSTASHGPMRATIVPQPDGMSNPNPMLLLSRARPPIHLDPQPPMGPKSRSLGAPSIAPGNVGGLAAPEVPGRMANPANSGPADQATASGRPTVPAQVISTLRHTTVNIPLGLFVLSPTSVSRPAAQPKWSNRAVPCIYPQQDSSANEVKLAVSCYRKEAEAGNAEAQFALGNIYFEARGVPRQDAQAAAWYRRAAEQGHAAAQNSLGMMYLNGLGVVRDPSQAVQWFQKSAEQGSPAGENNLGAAYVTGRGVRPDYIVGAQWLGKAAEAGIAEAQYALGTLYANGRGVPHDMNVAFTWLRRAAEQGYAPAQLLVGKLCFYGQGIKCDSLGARNWLNKAADQNLPEAAVLLAQMYRDGIGGSSDGKQAIAWLRRAALQGSAEAQYSLGETYKSGKAMPSDPVLAYAWFAVAGSNGDTRAISAINSLAPHMTLRQITEAQQQAHALAALVSGSRNAASELTQTGKPGR